MGQQVAQIGDGHLPFDVIIRGQTTTDIQSGRGTGQLQSVNHDAVFSQFRIGGQAHGIVPQSPRQHKIMERHLVSLVFPFNPGYGGYGQLPGPISPLPAGIEVRAAPGHVQQQRVA